jgi:putative intracellular protease/amidase
VTRHPAAYVAQIASEKAFSTANGGFSADFAFILVSRDSGGGKPARHWRQGGRCMLQIAWKKWLMRVAGLGTLVLVSALIVQRFASARAAQTKQPKEEALVLENYTRNVAIVLYEGVELLDFAGPGEVFAAAAQKGGDRDRPAFKVFTVAAKRQPIKSQGFLSITPDYAIDDAPAPDVLVIPGGPSAMLTNDERFMAWADAVMRTAKLTLTVCTGAFVPAKTGLLDGRSATTHHGAIERLRTAFVRVTVVDGKRFVDNGSIITTAGVSAGIDGALHAVARLLGRNVADGTARYMEYHWTPEAYLAASYPYLNPSLDEHGRALQQAEIYEDAKDWTEAEKAYRALTEKRPRDAWAWYGLGNVLQAKGEWDAAIAASERAASFDNVRPDALFNVACGYARKGNKDEAFSSLELAVKAGFKKKWRLESAADLAALREDGRYKTLLERL